MADRRSNILRRMVLFRLYPGAPVYLGSRSNWSRVSGCLLVEGCRRNMRGIFQKLFFGFVMPFGIVLSKKEMRLGKSTGVEGVRAEGSTPSGLKEPSRRLDFSL